MRGSWRIRQWLARRRSRRLTRAALAAVAPLPAATGIRHDLAGQLVVSLTSYPARYPTLHLTLHSLLDQSVRPDHLILWLSASDRALLPAHVEDLAALGLEVRVGDDLRSYKKLVPALESFPAAFHVTADDDLYYPPHWLAGLVRAYEDGAPAIIAWRAHLARCGTAGLLPYRQWEFATARTQASAGEYLFPTGVGGVLYPPGCLHPDVLDRGLFTRLCPEGDDIWFFWMARRHGWSHRRVPDWLDLVEWPGSQETGLRVANVDGNGNDRQIAAMQEAFGLLPILGAKPGGSPSGVDPPDAARRETTTRHNATGATGHGERS